MIVNENYICPNTIENLVTKAEHQIKMRREKIEEYKDDPDQVFAFERQIEGLEFTIAWIKQQ